MTGSTETAGGHQLESIQRWMLTTIQQPTGIDPRDRQVADVIQPSSRQTSAERLQIYADAYFARLLEVLTGEFPSLTHALGDELFAEFMLGYLQTAPSTSYTLSDLGARLPDYLRDTRPPREGTDPDWADFLIDCSRLERLYSEVFDGPGPERQPRLETWSLDAVPSTDSFIGQRLQVAPWVRLICLQFPIHEYITAVRKGLSPEIPTPQDTYLIVSRREFIVRRVPVCAAEFQLLQGLQSGLSIGDALSRLLGSPASATVSEETIERWFSNWTAAGYFLGVAPPVPGSGPVA